MLTTGGNRTAADLPRGARHQSQQLQQLGSLRTQALEVARSTVNRPAGAAAPWTAPLRAAGL
jgi:hypothetical protein